VGLAHDLLFERLLDLAGVEEVEQPAQPQGFVEPAFGTAANLSNLGRDLRGLTAELLADAAFVAREQGFQPVAGLKIARERARLAEAARADGGAEDGSRTR